MPGRHGAYGGKWPKARAAWLHRHPWCETCLKLGHRTPAVDVDHRVPWRQHAGGFWDKTNWRSLCAQHHRSKSGRESHGLGEKMGCDTNGFPNDPSHPWFPAAGKQ